ncbi:MAG: tetratricopeptide repeat protein [Syntrophales bacterium]
MKRFTGFILMVFIAAIIGGIGGCAGAHYQKGIKNYRPEDAAAAVRELRPLAERGNADAQFNLGSLYYQGWGLPQDYQEAVHWFRKAAEQRHPHAQATLGTIYAEGVQGVIAKDYPQALMWFIFAAAQGDAEAMEFRNELAARMTPAQITEAQKMAREFKPEDAYAKLYRELKSLAERGDPDAQLKVGLMHYQGRSAQKDLGEALQWFRKSAAQGNALAQANVGYMYDMGEGVPQNHVEAAGWYLKAAERGNAQAQFTLGSMYEKGMGVQQDEVQALMWFNLATAQGFGKAKAARDRITVWMYPEQIATAQRLAREFKILSK